MHKTPALALLNRSGDALCGNLQPRLLIARFQKATSPPKIPKPGIDSNIP